MSFFDSDAESSRLQPSHIEPRIPTRRSENEPIPDYDRQAARRSGRTSRRWHHWIPRIIGSLALLLVCAALLLLSVAAWLRHSMRASLPQVDGDLHIPGLSAPVTVTRDAHGVPSIQAASVDDALFAQGFVTAQDRLWQMDALRRHAAGELAEILGSKLAEHDRMQRILRISETAEQGIASLPTDQLHELQAYANGVNAFMQQNADHLPVEFHLLHYKPAPWTPRDSMLVFLSMFQDLATDFPVKMRREALSAHLPAQLIADLYPVGSWRDRPPTESAHDLTTPKPEIEQIPLDSTQTKLERPSTAAPQDILQVSSELSRDACEGCRSGSNNWAIAGSHSASGSPLVSNDMHLSLGVPDIWYEAGLHTSKNSNGTQLDVTGFTLPGAPFVIVGRNAHVAWSFTNLDGDVQDVRVEHTRGSGDTLEYQKTDGTWSPVAHHREHIHVRGGRDIDFDALTTTALIGTKEITTPVISPLYPTDHRVLSLAWTPYDAANLSLPFLASDSAATGEALVASFSALGGPSLNLVYADDSKHIGYHALGRIPVRGPAQRTSRNLAAPSSPTEAGPAPPDNDEDQGSEPQALLQGSGTFMPTSARPSLIPAAFFPSRRVRHVRRLPAPRPRGNPEPAEEPIRASPPAINYTIGSAISPTPVDTLDATQEWSGYIPYDQLPAVVDPANGILATANARITPNDYPYFIANDWTSPYRTERIYKLLEGRAHLTAEDMLSAQTDIHSEFDLVIAQRLAYSIDHASDAALKKDAKRLHLAADILRRWDGAVLPDSSAAAIVLSFRNVVWQALLGPQIAAHDHSHNDGASLKELESLYRWSGDGTALEALLQHTPQRWLPSGFSDWNDFLTGVLSQGLAASHAPSDLSRWHYGSMHPIEISHPVFSMSPLLDRLLGKRTGSGPQQTGGDNTTVQAIGNHFGPSERFTADLADSASVNGNITTGESGNPASEWYFDQFHAWLKGATFTLPLTATDRAHTLRLLP